MPPVAKKPSKQRKMIYEAPAHRVRKFLTAPLSEELRKSQERRSYPVRKGDTVKILRGDFAGIEGKINDIDTCAGSVYSLKAFKEKRLQGHPRTFL